MSDWSTPDDIRSRLRRMWDNGRILSAMTGSESPFPLRIPLKGPGTRALSERFVEAREWIAALVASEKGGGGPGYALEWREFTHRQLGANRVPIAAVVENERDALALLGKQREAAKFRDAARAICDRFPHLARWVAERPISVLEHASDWAKLLALMDWVVRHPLPRVYLRQIDAPGVDTKFIERHRALLGDLLDIVLPSNVIDATATGVRDFERRYGFLSRNVQIRFRLLDPALHIGGLSDLAVTSGEFARLALPARRIFITENEINFLAFPDVQGSMVVFGAGYGFDHLAQARWLDDKDIVYWGDIDTHGFAILDQLRAGFPSARSLMMDRETMLRHKAFWGKEDHPTDRDLLRLRPEEAVLYDDLRFNRLGTDVRLEQERIGFRWLGKALLKEGFPVQDESLLKSGSPSAGSSNSPRREDR